MWKGVKEALLEYDQFLIFTHKKPDADAIGSSIALIELLIKKNKKATLILEEALPSKYHFLTPGQEVLTLEEDREIIDERLCSVEALVWLDLNHLDRLGKCRSLFEESKKDLLKLPLVCIDHHKCKKLPSSFSLIDIEASSTAVMIYRLYKQMGETLNYRAAEALYASVLSDTGGFSVPNTASLDHYLAKECVDMGIHPASIHHHLYSSIPEERMTLYLRAMAQKEKFLGGSVQLIFIPLKLLSSVREIHQLSVELIHDLCRMIEGIQVWGVLLELKPDLWRLSLRSHEELGLNDLVSHWGGGGHSGAAGAQLEGSKEELILKLLSPLKKILNN